jgi:hypothetical protein
MSGTNHQKCPSENNFLLFFYKLLLWFNIFGSKMAPLEKAIQIHEQVVRQLYSLRWFVTA